MPGEDIVRVGHTGEDVDAFIRQQLLPAVQEAPLSLVATSFITLLLCSMGPDDLTEDEIIDGVKEVSGSLMMFIATLRTSQAEMH